MPKDTDGESQEVDMFVAITNSILTMCEGVDFDNALMSVSFALGGIIEKQNLSENETQIAIDDVGKGIFTGIKVFRSQGLESDNG